MSSGVRAAAWQPIGFGTQGGSSKFRVFVDTDSIQVFGGKVRFWQGHVFYDEQTLPSGKAYIRVSISRVVDCNDLSDSTLEAVFYGASGDIVDKYGTQGVMQFHLVKPDTVSGEVLKFVCDYANKKS
ncbi:MAG: surface-adhesin E family protein [Thermodesulfobacteriota bacterium]